MTIVTIIENNAITGVRYGTVEIKEYNRFRYDLKRASATKSKVRGR